MRLILCCRVIPMIFIVNRFTPCFPKIPVCDCKRLLCFLFGTEKKEHHAMLQFLVFEISIDTGNMVMVAAPDGAVHVRRSISLSLRMRFTDFPPLDISPIMNVLLKRHSGIKRIDTVSGILCCCLHILQCTGRLCCREGTLTDHEETEENRDKSPAPSPSAFRYITHALHPRPVSQFPCMLHASP